MRCLLLADSTLATKSGRGCFRNGVLRIRFYRVIRTYAGISSGWSREEGNVDRTIRGQGEQPGPDD